MARASADGDRHEETTTTCRSCWRAERGGVRPGRHGAAYLAGTPLTNLYLSMLDRLDVELPTFGDATGRLGSLG